MRSVVIASLSKVDGHEERDSTKNDKNQTPNGSDIGIAPKIWANCYGSIAADWLAKVSSTVFANDSRRLDRLGTEWARLRSR